MQVRHQHRDHAGIARGDDTGLGIFQHDAVVRGDTKARGGSEENIRRRLAAGDFVAADQRVEATEQAELIEPGAGALAAG